MWVHVIKDRVSQDVIFEGRIVIGQIVQKWIVKNQLSWAKYSRAFTQSRIVEGLLVRTKLSEF